MCGADNYANVTRPNGLECPTFERDRARLVRRGSGWTAKKYIKSLRCPGVNESANAMHLATASVDGTVSPAVAAQRAKRAVWQCSPRFPSARVGSLRGWEEAYR